jgi:hypothetical protein
MNLESRILSEAVMQYIEKRGRKFEIKYTKTKY